ncbi:MAG: LysR family transcriptional regulator [Bacillota bacterium]|nr:LysR family transcriptional regulator [Bacillota bacterium]
MSEQFRCYIRIRLGKEESPAHSTFGPGVASLLRGIEATGSLYSSAKGMGMAYSKAWKTLQLVEEELGWPLIKRNGPRGSELTERGRKLLTAYQRMQEAADRAVMEILDEKPF